MKQIIFDISNEYLDKLTDKDMAIRRYVEKEIEKHITTGSLYRVSIDKLFKIYEATRNYYLPSHSTLIVVFGVSMYGKEFLDKFGPKDSICWSYRMSKYQRMREKVRSKHLVKPKISENAK